VGRRAGLDVSGKEKMPGLELRTIQPRVDYILYVSEEGAACIFEEKYGGRAHILGVGEFKPDCTKLTAVPSTQNKRL
jgi:hypothetical protein